MASWIPAPLSVDVKMRRETGSNATQGGEMCAVEAPSGSELIGIECMAWNASSTNGKDVGLEITDSGDDVQEVTFNADGTGQGSGTIATLISAMRSGGSIDAYNFTLEGKSIKKVRLINRANVAGETLHGRIIATQVQVS